MVDEVQAVAVHVVDEVVEGIGDDERVGLVVEIVVLLLVLHEDAVDVVMVVQEGNASPQATISIPQGVWILQAMIAGQPHH